MDFATFKNTITYGTMFDGAKFGAISDFDKKNFDECCCLPIKCLILFLLLLHVLAAIITTPRHTAYMYLVMMFLFHFVNCCSYMHVVIMFIKTIDILILDISCIGKENLEIAMTLLP